MVVMVPGSQGYRYILKLVPVTGRRLSPSLSHKPHTAHHSLGTLVISAGFVYFLPGVWRASQSEGT